MEVQRKPVDKSATDKLKIEPFRLVGKTNLKDAPIFEMENEAEENKRRQRRLVDLKNTLSQEEKKKEKGIGDDAARPEGDGGESKDMDVLEVNAVNDGSIEDDLNDAAVVVLGEEGGGGTGEEQKHHKKRKKHEKKKKRRKEKADDDRRDKQVKKHHRGHRSKDRSVSRSSSSTRRHRSSSDCRQSRDRSWNRSRERHHRGNSSGREWRYSPSRFDSQPRSQSCSRSPPGNLSHRRGRDRSPQAESARKRTLSTSLSPETKADTKKQRSPRKKSPRAKSPRAKSPRAKSPRGKSPRKKSPRKKSRKKSPRSKSPRVKSSGVKSPTDSSHRVKSPRKKSPRAKSPTKKSTSKSPLVLSSQRRSDSEAASAAETKTRVDSSGNELSEVLSRGSGNSVVVIETPLSQKSPRKSPHKSPAKSPRVLSKDSSQPINVIVPCALQDEERDTAPAINKPESGSGAAVVEDKVYVGITNASSLKKKVKAKKKAKRGDEEKKKKKKSAARPDVVDAVRNSDDELEDLLFTKTNKETKFEAVFHDSEIVSAKHDLRMAVVDLEPRVVVVDVEPRTELARDRYPVCQEISPAASPLANMASEPYKPEEPTDEGNNEFSPLEPPPRPPSIPGFFPSIPFLTEKQQQQQVDDGPRQLIENNAGDAVYSPIENLTPVDSPDIENLTPVDSPGKPSPVHLSDISRRESTVENTVGVITPAEKIEDFLGRMPGSFTQPDASEVVDMDMSPTNGMNATFQSSEDDDDIIEQLHKEFVRSQNEVDKAPVVALGNMGIWGNSGTWGSDGYEPAVSLSPTLDVAEDPIVVAFKTRGKKHREMKHKTRKEKKLLPLAKEKKDIEEALNRVHRQARVEEEMKHVLKAYFKHKDITKEEYKMILRKAVPQVANSDHGIDPERIRSLAKKYVAKYKGIRLRDTKILDQSLADQVYSPTSQDMAVVFSP